MNLRTALSFNDVLLVPQFSTIASRQEVNLSTQIAPDIKLSLPLIAVNMDTVVGVEMAKKIYALGGIAFYPRFNTIENTCKEIKEITDSGAKVIASIGIKDGYAERAQKLLDAGAIALTIDVAHAHTQRTLMVTEDLKRLFPNVSLIVGTVATYQGAYDLFRAGADTVRVGVGAGTICTTRIVAGSGVPQVTAISEASKAKNHIYIPEYFEDARTTIRNLKEKYIIADGGMVNSGDITKALALGANAVCLGSLFAGTDEAPGDIIEIDNQKYKEYNGSTSKTEKVKQVKKNSADKHQFYTQHVEGVEGLIKYKGPVENVVNELIAGLRSGFSYSGARKIEDLQRNAQFIQITPAGLRESQAHDIIIK